MRGSCPLLFAVSLVVLSVFAVVHAEADEFFAPGPFHIGDTVWEPCPPAIPQSESLHLTFEISGFVTSAGLSLSAAHANMPARVDFNGVTVGSLPATGDGPCEPLSHLECDVTHLAHPGTNSIDVYCGPGQLVLDDIWVHDVRITYTSEEANGIYTQEGPIHLGDALFESCNPPNPNGPTLVDTFVLPYLPGETRIRFEAAQVYGAEYVSTVSVNGTYVGTIAASPAADCSIYDTIFSESVASLVHTGVNTLEIQCGLAGSNYDDIWFRNIAIYCDPPPTSPFEILSATFDRNHYQNGQDTAVLTVVMQRNWGQAGTLLDLRASATARIGDNVTDSGYCFLWPMSTDTSTVELTLEVPWAEYSSEYTAHILLLGESGEPLDGMTLDPAFIGTGLDESVIQQYQEDLQECWLDSNSECVLYLVDMIPVASSFSHGAKFVERMCEAGALNRSGHPHEAWAVAKDGFMEFGETAVGIYGGLLGEYQDFYEFLDFFANIGEFARDCSDGEFGGGGAGLREEVPAGDLVDSLAVWIRAADDSSDALLADALLVEGHCRVAVEADSSWANRDSTGLSFVDFAAAESLGSVVFVSKGVHRLTEAEGQNPRSSARLTVIPQSDEVLNVGLLHRTEADSLVFVRYPEFAVSDSSVVTVVVADSISVPMLEVDLDGDGTIDFLWYPGAAGVESEPVVASRGSALFLRSAPNPMSGSTSLTLRSASSLKGVTVSVFDVAGREVRRLSVGDLSPGAHQVLWDGRTDDGRQVASGIYYCVASYSGGGSTPKRLVVLR